MTDEQHSKWQSDLEEMEILLMTLDHILGLCTLWCDCALILRPC